MSQFAIFLIFMILKSTQADPVDPRFYPFTGYNEVDPIKHFKASYHYGKIIPAIKEYFNQMNRVVEPPENAEQAWEYSKMFSGVVGFKYIVCVEEPDPNASLFDATPKRELEVFVYIETGLYSVEELGDC